MERAKEQRELLSLGIQRRATKLEILRELWAKHFAIPTNLWLESRNGKQVSVNGGKIPDAFSSAGQGDCGRLYNFHRFNLASFALFPNQPLPLPAAVPVSYAFQSAIQAQTSRSNLEQAVFLGHV